MVKSMGEMDMGISEITHVSYFFTGVAVLLGILSVAMYFALDIRRCWGIVRGRRFVSVKENTSYFGETGEGEQQTERLCNDRTELLCLQEETVLPETMTLVQDIVLMDADFVDCARQ